MIPQTTARMPMSAKKAMRTFRFCLMAFIGLIQSRSGPGQVDDHPDGGQADPGRQGQEDGDGAGGRGDAA